jgi:crotonobetainyl-CoA:carnitine CoA-transferase CaiB-like acyl-CoA transferase
MSAPLEGIRVLDLSVSVAGPFCSMLLADMGAEVIKIEPPSGDISRKWGPPFVEENSSAYYFSLNRNKKSICLNLKEPEDRATFTALLKKSDVLIESFRPGVLDKLGFSFDEVHSLNRKLVYCSISGYGQDGPSSQDPAFDLMIQARSGLMSVTGESSMSPIKIGVPIVDLVTGIYSSYAVAVAISGQNRDAEGRKIDISMLDSAFSLLCYWVTGYSITGRELPRQGNGHPTMVPYQVFETKDGSIAISASDSRQWERFTRALNRGDLFEDPRFVDNAARVGHREELVSAIQKILLNYDRNSILSLMREYGVPCSPVQTIKDVIGDPQLQHRGMIQRIGDVLVPGCPVKMSGFAWNVRTAPPKQGQDVLSILEDLEIPKEI